MSLLDKIKESAQKRRTKECKVFEQTVLCVLHSKKSMLRLQKEFEEASKEGAEEGKAEAILAEQFLDPETMQPVLTVDFLENDCSQADALKLIQIFLRMNGADTEALERAEKNS